MSVAGWMYECNLSSIAPNSRPGLISRALPLRLLEVHIDTLGPAEGYPGAVGNYFLSYCGWTFWRLN